MLLERRPFNTVGPSSEEGAPHGELMQLKHWFGGQDRFDVFWKASTAKRRWRSDLGIHVCLQPPFVNLEPGAIR